MPCPHHQFRWIYREPPTPTPHGTYTGFTGDQEQEPWAGSATTMQGMAPLFQPQNEGCGVHTTCMYMFAGSTRLGGPPVVKASEELQN